MAKRKETGPIKVYAGQEDLKGALCTEVGWNELTFTKDGRTFTLELEEEWPMTCMCEDSCYCQPSSYLRVMEIK